MDHKKKIVAFLISAGLITGVVKHEGFRDKAYIPVPGDVPTVGVGFTKREDGTPVRMGDTITREQADARLKKELWSYRTGIGNCIMVPVTENQADAFTSLSFNIGVSAFCKSTLTRKLNQYDYEGACAEILKWDKFQGKPLKGLTNRRQDEYKKCMQP
jgi:lysozyme